MGAVDDHAARGALTAARGAPPPRRRRARDRRPAPRARALGMCRAGLAVGPCVGRRGPRDALQQVAAFAWSSSTPRGLCRLMRATAHGQCNWRISTRTGSSRSARYCRFYELYWQQEGLLIVGATGRSVLWRRSRRRRAPPRAPRAFGRWRWRAPDRRSPLAEGVEAVASAVAPLAARRGLCRDGGGRRCDGRSGAAGAGRRAPPVGARGGGKRRRRPSLAWSGFAPSRIPR
jgi:hypothetical protein